LPDAGVIRALTAAAQRGINVSVLVPELSDVPLVDWARGALYDRLLRGGVRLFHWVKSMLHAKVAVVDDAWASIGSYNLDWRSLLHNREVVVNVPDPGFASTLAAALRADIDASVEITSEAWQQRPAWKKWLFEPTLHALRRYL
jgi:cardiolipin synthase A/B